MSSFVDEDILELPGVFEVEVFISEFILTVLQRVPIGVVASYRTDVLLCDIEAEFVVHRFSFRKTPLGIGQGPRHTRNGRGGNLQRSGILIGYSFPCILNRELGTVPIGIFSVAIEQNSELVYPRHNLFFNNLPILSLGHFPRTH